MMQNFKQHDGKRKKCCIFSGELFIDDLELSKNNSWGLTDNKKKLKRLAKAMASDKGSRCASNVRRDVNISCQSS